MGGWGPVYRVAIRVVPVASKQASKQASSLSLSYLLAIDLFNKTSLNFSTAYFKFIRGDFIGVNEGICYRNCLFPVGSYRLLLSIYVLSL